MSGANIDVNVIILKTISKSFHLHAALAWFVKAAGLMQCVIKGTGFSHDTYAAWHF
jgi:hypothetical protein